METSSARPYFAIFAVVAIVAAGFILKQEYAGADQQKVQESSPQRQFVLAKGGGGMVPESIDAWFNRVGYQRLGFESADDMKLAQQMSGMRGGLPNVTPEQAALIRKLIASKGIPYTIGISLLAKIKDTKDRQDFMPDVRALYTDGGRNQDFKRTVKGWYISGDKDLAKTFQKDKDPAVVNDVNNIIFEIENPGKDGAAG